MPSQTREEDQVMEDAPINGQDGELPVAEEEEEPEKQRIRVVRRIALITALQTVEQSNII